MVNLTVSTVSTIAARSTGGITAVTTIAARSTGRISFGVCFSFVPNLRLKALLISLVFNYLFSTVGEQNVKFPLGTIAVSALRVSKVGSGLIVLYFVRELVFGRFLKRKYRRLIFR